MLNSRSFVKSDTMLTTWDSITLSWTVGEGRGATLNGIMYEEGKTPLLIDVLFFQTILYSKSVKLHSCERDFL